mgnify:CR=1 FL=1
MSIAKNTICLWFDREAEQAARFYAETFPDSAVDEIVRAPADFPSGRAGDVLIAISTSGKSPNVLKAAEAARALGVKVVAMMDMRKIDVAAIEAARRG